VTSDPPTDGRNRPARSGPTPVPPPPSDKPTILRSPRNALEPDKVPPPKRRSKRVRHPLVIAGNAIFTMLVLLSLAAGAALYVGKQRFEAPGPLTENKVVNIPRGLGIRDIALLLEREGVIDQPYVFIGGVLVMKARGDLKHGEYEFTRNASLADVVDTISEGKVVQHALTIPEGLTSEQIVARLLENTALSRRPSDLDAGRAGDACLDRRKGNRQVGRTLARRRRLRQPAQEQDAAAIRSDHHLRPRGRQGLAWPAHPKERNRAADAL
jgi:hypothetical protein